MKILLKIRFEYSKPLLEISNLKKINIKLKILNIYSIYELM